MVSDIKEMLEQMKPQSDEFEALSKLATAFKNLPAVVDDNYPEMRHYYESALKTFIDAIRANNRI